MSVVPKVLICGSIGTRPHKKIINYFGFIYYQSLNYHLFKKKIVIILKNDPILSVT